MQHDVEKNDVVSHHDNVPQGDKHDTNFSTHDQGGQGVGNTSPVEKA